MASQCSATFPFSSTRRISKDTIVSAPNGAALRQILCKDVVAVLEHADVLGGRARSGQHWQSSMKGSRPGGDEGVVLDVYPGWPIPAWGGGACRCPLAGRRPETRRQIGLTMQCHRARAPVAKQSRGCSCIRVFFIELGPFSGGDIDVVRRGRRRARCRAASLSKGRPAAAG